MNYLYAICVIAVGLILAGMAVIEWLSRDQEKRARKKPAQKKEEDFWPEYQPTEKRKSNQ